MSSLNSIPQEEHSGGGGGQAKVVARAKLDLLERWRDLRGVIVAGRSRHEQRGAIILA